MLCSAALLTLAFIGAPEPNPDTEGPDPSAESPLPEPQAPSSEPPPEPSPPVVDELEPASPSPPPAPPAETSRLRPGWGGFGYTTVGVVVGDWGAYGNALSHPEGTTLSPARAAVLVGGGGAMLLGGRYVLAGKGFGVLAPALGASWGGTSLNGGGGGFDVGVVVVNNERWLIYPQFGLGGQGYTLTVRNRSDQDLGFGTGGLTVDAGSEASFRSGFFTAEIGVAFQRLMFSRKDGGGLISGGELGVMMSISDSEWSDRDDAAVAGVAPLRLVAAYLRMDIGGGGFWWSKFGGTRN